MAIGKCRQEACPVEKTGKCLEGFEKLEECPHFITPPELEEIKEIAKVEVAELPKEIEFLDGDGFSPETATSITGAAVTRLIILAGAAESGKTTLLASLYGCFQEGPFAGYLFAGSQTLMGFERRCHLSRITSGREKPDTERTKPGSEKNLLHLRVRIEDLSRPAQNLLLSDISGETFRLAKDSTDEVLKLEMLKRADYFVLLLDGDKLSQQKTRQETFIDGVSLLRSCLDAKILGKNSFVNVLFTKWDLIEDNSDKAKILQFIDHVETEMEERFKSRVGQLRFFRIAARPQKPLLEFGYGLKEIFPSWVEYGSQFHTVPLIEPCHLVPEREFDRYLYRWLGIY
jgi:hypothetical protein